MPIARNLWERFQRWESRLSPLQIVAVFAVLASLWVVLTSWILAGLAAMPASYARLEIFKDFAFVLVSALLLLGLISRLTQRTRQSEAQLAHADRLASVGTMAASVAHEVNNPLTTIKVLIHTLRDKTPEGNPDRDDLDVVLDEINKIRALILRFLQFARPGEPEPARLHIEDVVTRVVNLVRPQASTRSIQIVEKYDAAAGNLWADQTQMGQVILNVLLNAVDATPKGGEIHVTTRTDTAGMLQLRIWNSGPPLAEDLHERIFEPFFSTKAHGTGLGLPIAQTIVRKHRGRIWAEGVPTGGTAVYVQLPRVMEETPGASSTGR